MVYLVSVGRGMGGGGGADRVGYGMMGVGYRNELSSGLETVQ